MSAYVEKLKNAYVEANALLQWDKVVKYGAAALGTYTVYCFAVKPFLSPLRKIPGPSYGPVFGNVREAMVGEAMDTSVGLVKKYGGVVHFYHLLGYDRVLVADPQSLKHVLVTKENNYNRTTGGSLLGKSIFTVSGEEHKFHRRLMNQYFSHEAIKNYLSVFHNYGDRLVEKWEEALSGQQQVEIHVTDDLKKMALDVLGKTIFNFDFNSLAETTEVSTAIQYVINVQVISFAQVIPFYSWLPTKRNRDNVKYTKIVDDFIYEMIKNSRKQMEMAGGEGEKPRDLLSKLMAAVDTETGKGFDDKCLRDNVLSIFIAGHETTAVTLSWLLLTLAQHPDIQDRLRTEVNSVFPARGEEVDWDHLDGLEYMTAVIKEGQRLFPAAPTFTRQAQQDDTINGHFIPKGTQVIYHIGAMMRDPKIWPDPEKFDPDRFVDGKLQDLYTHIPFATGPHKCLGHRFAKTEMKHILASLIREFQFDVIPGTHFKRKLRITLNPDPPVRLYISKVV